MILPFPDIKPPDKVIVPSVTPEVCKHMAQTTIPVYLTGKVGSIVYTGNRQGTAVRTKVTGNAPPAEQAL